MFKQKKEEPVVQLLRSLFKTSLPQVLDITRIDKIMDRRFLETLEYQYEKFLEANIQLLDLYNVIDYLLNVRDAILIKLNRMTREENIRKYNEEYYRTDKYKAQADTHADKTQAQADAVKILIEYNCGCQNLIHYGNNNNNNSPSRHHCITHLTLLRTQSTLDQELTKIKNELQYSTNQENIKSINYCR